MDRKVSQNNNRKRKTTLILTAIVAVVVLSIVITILWKDKPSIKRPQEPTMPYAYYSEDVTFRNLHANITLAGTLTLPAKEGNYPAVILITGSGPQNRDEEMLGHKPFLVISDHLTKNGIAVLRYDDRGFGQSTGDFKSGTSGDFATDVESAISYLKTRKEINKNKIGLVGHSDGAMIAPMVAAKSQDVAFIVLMAGPGVKGDQLLINRQELIERAAGLPESEIQKSKKRTKAIIKIIVGSSDTETLKRDLTKFAEDNFEDIPDSIIPLWTTRKRFISKKIDMIANSWNKFFFSYDPAPVLEKVGCPVLALNGNKDVQVPSTENLGAIKIALTRGGNKSITIIELPGLNHLFQECGTGMPDEYTKIDQTFSPRALAEISDWVLKQVKINEN